MGLTRWRKLSLHIRWSASYCWSCLVHCCLTNTRPSTRWYRTWRHLTSMQLARDAHDLCDPGCSFAAGAARRIRTCLVCLHVCRALTRMQRQTSRCINTGCLRFARPRRLLACSPSDCASPERPSALSGRRNARPSARIFRPDPRRIADTHHLLRLRAAHLRHRLSQHTQVGRRASQHARSCMTAPPWMRWPSPSIGSRRPLMRERRDAHPAV